MKRILTFIFFALALVSMILFVACTKEPTTEPDADPTTVNHTENEPDNTTDPETDTENTPENEPEQTADPEEEPEQTTQPEAEPEPEEERLEATPLCIPDEEINWDAGYNTPKVEFDDIVPGLVSQNVYVGYEGWMFFGDTMDDYTGKRSFVEKRLERISERLNERLNWLNERGTKMYLVITPNKNSVYPEFMATEGVNMAEERGLDVLVKYLRENTEINVIDCREGLAEAKTARPDEILYYKLDTHWNNHGGFAAYTQIMNAIKQDFPLAVQYTRDDYQIDYFPSYMKDEAYYLGWYDTFTEEGPVYTLKSGTQAKLIYRNDSGPYGEFIHAFIHPDGYRDKTDYCVYENEAIPGAPSIYMIRDSFAIALVPFLKESFSKSTFSWSFAFNTDDIESKDPDIVIMQVVERSLNDFFNQKAFN